ncbi:relaxase/mobilization nuclease domain-containing protein [Klebsiella sp. PL-2018]|uniref:relaxase/mobilization nuclease domain-containing protein n=1 Tax=Klebsiella sp. PL-2018 TaxID=2851540 RepID=UPI001C23B3E2|nr:relaxase/mobilization nuclease domain-containing protein [Klebsiella sp. PL-2018]QXD01190.1 involved in conjugative DNA transfer [Klebsiella sp. PL-2018]
MIPVIPPKRQDGKSSFEDLVSYVAVRDDVVDDDLKAVVEKGRNAPHRNRFSRLVDYATRLREGAFVELVDTMKDGCEWINFYGVTCFHNCSSLETAAQDMAYTADKAHFGGDDSDPVFHYILSWQSHESPHSEQIYDSVRHTLKALGLSSHQYMSAVHTDTDNLHVHVAVNRVHPETGYYNCLSWSKEKLNRACRELELKHGFAPDNGCYVIAPDKRIVRRTGAERNRQSGWTRGKPQTFQAYIADTAIMGLREAPVTDWTSLHQRFAREGLYLAMTEGRLEVKDGWVQTRAGVDLSGFGPSWSLDRLTQRLGAWTPPAQDIFQKTPDVGRYDLTRVPPITRPEVMQVNQTLAEYATEHLRSSLAWIDAEPSRRRIGMIHGLLAQSGLFLKEQNDGLVICDGFSPGRTPVRAEYVWPVLTKPLLSTYEGGWRPVPSDIFQQIKPARQYTGGELVPAPATDERWLKMRTGTGPAGALKREIFSDKESLWGYAASHCRLDLDNLIIDGQFTWQGCHELLARQGLLLRRQHQGLAVVDAYHPRLTGVKASHVHPDLTLARAEPYAGPFEEVAADIFERVQITHRYDPERAVSDRDIPSMKRDPELRRQRREARAAARQDLRARYELWREGWRKPDLRYGERSGEIHQACRMKKAHARVQFRDPLVRKLHYHIAEVQRMQALIALKQSVREERLTLVDAGKWYPPTFRQWVAGEALKGDKAAISQLRGWDYRSRRNPAASRTTDSQCVVICEPGGEPAYNNFPDSGLHATLKHNGCVQFTNEQAGEFICSDYGDRVVFRNHEDYETLKNVLVKTSPVLFSRNDSVEMSPEGEDEPFNTAFAKMVAWRNVTAGDGLEYRVARPTLDRLRIEQEERYQDMLNPRTYHAGPVEDERPGWTPPSP